MSEEFTPARSSADETGIESTPVPPLPEDAAGSEPQFEMLPELPELFTYVAPKPRFTRIPNLADTLLFFILLGLGLLVTGGAQALVVHFHLLGLHNTTDALNGTRGTLGTEVLIYLVALVIAIPLFRILWHKGYFDGIHWHASTAFRLRYRLAGTAILCNLIAIVGNVVLPFPEHAPIDKLFTNSADAWLLLLFGVGVAPFFEEMIFRGFLLPSVATTLDWSYERIAKKEPEPPDNDGNPTWSVAAMIVASLLVSAPFALMHSPQVAHSWGPLLLLYCVSLILCVVRFATRSLAASTLVHSTYNLLLFAVMFAQTDGFRHMDKI